MFVGNDLSLKNIENLKKRKKCKIMTSMKKKIYKFTKTAENLKLKLIVYNYLT